MIPQVHFLAATPHSRVYCVDTANYPEAIASLRSSAATSGETQVCLVPEPDNPFDSRAISVRTLDGRVAGYISAVENSAYFRALEPVVATGGVAIARTRFTDDGTLILLLPQPADILTPYSLQTLASLPRIHQVLPGRYNQQWPTFLTPQGTVDPTRVPHEQPRTPAPAPEPPTPPAAQYAPQPSGPAPVHVQVNLPHARPGYGLGSTGRCNILRSEGVRPWMLHRYV